MQPYNTDLFHFRLLPCFCSTHAVAGSPGPKTTSQIADMEFCRRAPSSLRTGLKRWSLHLRLRDSVVEISICRPRGRRNRSKSGPMRSTGGLFVAKKAESLEQKLNLWNQLRFNGSRGVGGANFPQSPCLRITFSASAGVFVNPKSRLQRIFFVMYSLVVESLNSSTRTSRIWM
jgi:hypothetical protein